MITDLRINAKGELEGKVIPPAKWEEMYTKEEVAAMLEEIKEKVESVSATDLGEVFIRNSCRDVIQEKINALKTESENKE